jgi:hypothetical protein
VSETTLVAVRSDTGERVTVSADQRRPDAGRRDVPFETAAFDVASREDMKGKLIVAIIPSFAERYVSTALFEGL